MGNSNPSSAINTLVGGTHVEGTIVAKSDIRIDGTVEGVLDCSGKLIIGMDGKVEGEATCQNAVIEGTFRGTLVVHDSLLRLRVTRRRRWWRGGRRPSFS